MSHVDATLGNGLKIVLVPQPGLHRAVAMLYLRAGSRFETREDNGISHFLEHMVFRGTKALPSAHAQALAFERLGGTLYAATHVDHGVMSVAVPPRNLEKATLLLGDVTTDPLFTEIEIERGIVREEILEDKDDEGREVDADNLARALMFGAHPLGFTITGDIESLDRFDEARLRRHHATHYTADNAVLCLAGNLSALGDPERFLAVCEEAFGAMPRGSRVPLTPPPPPGPKPGFRFVENQSSQTALRVAFRAASERDAREPSVEMLLRILDDGMSTRLYERICDRKGLCYDVSAMFECYEDDGVVDIAAEARHDRAGVVLAEIFSLLRELRDKGPTAEELDKAKDRHLWATESMRDDAEGLASFYGLAALADIARTPEARHAELERVTVDDVREAARWLFVPQRLSVVAVGMLTASEERRLEKAVMAF